MPGSPFGPFGPMGPGRPGPPSSPTSPAGPRSPFAASPTQPPVSPFGPGGPDKPITNQVFVRLVHRRAAVTKTTCLEDRDRQGLRVLRGFRRHPWVLGRPEHPSYPSGRRDPLYRAHQADLKQRQVKFIGQTRRHCRAPQNM